MITHLVILDTVHHDNLKLLCMNEKGPKETRHRGLQHSDFDLACITSFVSGVHSVLRSIEIVLRIIHLHDKHEKILGLQSTSIVRT